MVGSWHGSFHLSHYLLPIGQIHPSTKQKLLRWFDAHQRPLAWRRTRDPYAIWISEVMLQQTTVAAVGPFFQRFLSSFPTIFDLARADEQQVLRHWAGLGYYSRAKNLHRAAQILVSKYNGVFLPDPAIWKDLPGVGPYILGAVLSQAFDLPMPIVEANTKRLFTRLFAQAGDLNSKVMQKWLWATAENLLPQERCGDFNQALMEVGATLCTPKAPQCSVCPFQNVCRAYQEGSPEKYPSVSKRVPITEVQEVALVPVFRSAFLLFLRPALGRWANMWEFPHREIPSTSTASQVLSELRHDYALEGEILPEFTVIKYPVTRYRYTMHAHKIVCTSETFRLHHHTQGQWVDAESISSFPTSSPQKKIIKKFLEEC